ncbi:MAG: hypothetical protein V4579_10935 [Pseudomonadota bacterium]
MKRSTLILTAAAAALVLPAAAAGARPHLSPQQKLDKMLEGRVAGEPVSCIDTLTHRNSTVIDKTAIVYGSGRTIYVNRPAHPESLRRDDVLVTRLHSTRLCNVDVVKLLDRSGGWYRGFVGLGDFVPYTRVRTASR